MKRIMIVSLIGISLLLSGCSSELVDDIEVVDESTVIVIEDRNDEYTSPMIETMDDWGSGSALVQESFTIEEMLVYAIQDEYTAKSEYVMIMEEFNVTKPFSNIYPSEDTHISILLPLFEAYDINVPVDDSENHLFEIESVEEAYDIGVIAEINNIAMYNLFLEQDLPDDVRDVFIKLRDASMNHLSAFEKNAAKS